MTTRVFEFQHRVASPARELRSRRPGASLMPAGLIALVLVPLAGAAEPPNGWLVAGATAVTLLCLAAVIGDRVSWGWLLLLVSAAGLVMPRGQFGVIGPGLFVAAVVCLVLWWTNHGDGGRRRTGRGHEPGPREREAQFQMGLSGERQVGRVLASELPQEYVLINGLKLPRGAGDIDHLVVGPTGVFVLETKTMAGRIVCEADGTWRRTRVGRAGTAYAAYIGDPATQVRRNIFSTRECLRNRLPRLFRGRSLWIEGLVVFAHPQTELQAEYSRVPALLLEEAVSRICLHTPQRRLQPTEIDAVVGVLLNEAREEPRGPVRQSAQALVEVALVVPIVLALVFGTIAVSRVVQAQTAAVAVAHEAARAAALGRSPQDAVDRMRERVDLVAPGLGLDPRVLVVEWDVSRFGQSPGQVVALVRYPIDFVDLPLAGWLPPAAVRAEHVEWVDPFRSGIALQRDAAD